MQQIINSISAAFTKLKQKDGCLFEIPIEKNSEYKLRKLHEVCINHKLANYLEEFFFEAAELNRDQFFVDIEFNREGTNYKELEYDDESGRVRPDIIIHNRKSGDDKKNIIVVECKKAPVNDQDLNKDISKLKAFLTDEKYLYDFGLQVTYSSTNVSGQLYYKNEGQILDMKI
jgi:hypothetical protein